MLAGPLVFMDIDTQRDFLEESGALYVPESSTICPGTAVLTTVARIVALQSSSVVQPE